MNPVVLFRQSLADEGEMDCALDYFPVYQLRSEIPPGSLVIPRYSSLPYYSELECDVLNNGSELINTYEQHKWIADFSYYEALQAYTFKTWDTQSFAKDAPEGRYVVKGKTNSRKHYWRDEMFAENKSQALLISYDLMTDEIISNQGIIFREYVPLVEHEIGINGLPFSNEWRCFCYKSHVLAVGYYWSIAQKTDWDIPIAGVEFALKLSRKISKIPESAPFYVMDIAEKEDGGWILVELNCGTMSGLSMVDAQKLYSSLNIILLTER